MSTDPTVERALAYAACGWPVFPCQPGGKQPATRHGFLDATIDPDHIRWWWRRDPGANLAIATGTPGPDVLDVDQHGDAGSGYPALNRLARAGLTRDAAAVVASRNPCRVAGCLLPGWHGNTGHPHAAYASARSTISGPFMAVPPPSRRGHGRWRGGSGVPPRS